VPYLHDDVLDSGLSVLTSAGSKVLHICTSEPTTRANAISTSLGNKSAPTVGSPTARAPSGRKVVVSAISDGNVTANGTASHWALIDGTRLLAAAPLSASQVVTSPNVFTTAAFDIGIPGPA
jgi:hypothetical protein